MSSAGLTRGSSSPPPWPASGGTRSPTSSATTTCAAYQGDRIAESMRYLRSYPAELPVLCGLLPQIHTPVQIIAGARDTAVPPANAEFLHQRLPRSRLDIIDAGHFTWEDAADEYAALVTSWWSGGYAPSETEGVSTRARHIPQAPP